jgi:hypothetical protein
MHDRELKILDSLHNRKADSNATDLEPLYRESGVGAAVFFHDVKDLAELGYIEVSSLTHDSDQQATGTARITTMGEQALKTGVEVSQALETIRREGPKTSLVTTSNIRERAIIEELTKYASDRSNLQRLCQTIRATAIDQHGLISTPTKERINEESDRIFHIVAKQHFTQLTDSQIDALYRSLEETIKATVV